MLRISLGGTVRNRLALVLAVALGAASCVGAVHLGSRAAASQQSSRPPTQQPRAWPATGQRPNIVLLTSDDQTDVELRWMPRTRRLLARQGVTFTDSISPHPLCCPARAEILTGEYAQNNGVRHNTGPYGGYSTFLTANDGLNVRSNLGVWLRQAGYSTAVVGKLLNGYGEGGTTFRLPGWNIWDPTQDGTYWYYGSTFTNNGDPVKVRKRQTDDEVGRRAVRYIDRLAPRERPFFLWASFIGPHLANGRKAHRFYGRSGWVPPVPSYRHRTLFDHVRLPSAAKPSFLEPDVSDKPSQILDEQPGMTRAQYVELFRARLRALQSIDEANAAIVRAVARAGELQRTVFIFTSDNGYQLGEHGLIEKNFPYEESLQVPLVMRGPGIPAGTTSAQTALTIDLAPTILDYAGALAAVRGEGRLDGGSLLTALRGTPHDTTTLIQGGTADAAALEAWGWWFRGVRTERYTWVRWWTGEIELYDRWTDPLELSNLYDNQRERLADERYEDVLAELEERYSALKACKGVGECRSQDFGPMPDPTTDERSSAPSTGTRSPLPSTTTPSRPSQPAS